MENNQSNNDNGNSNNNQGGGNNNNKKKPSATIIILILSVLMTLAFWQTYSKFKDSGKEQITYDEFLTMLDDGNVQNVKIYSNEITFEPAVQDENAVYEVSYSVVRTDDFNLIERLAKAGVTFEEIDEGGSVIVQTILSYGIMIVAFYLLMMLIMKSATKSGGVMGVGKSNAKMYVQTETGVTFKDVAGQEEAKESLSEMVDFLEKPEKYLQIGAKLPRGALLVGPPGTGKTLLAKAVAGEAKVPFFSLSGSDFVELYVGVGASRVRDLFKRANAMAPCIIFIDEIDAIGRSRDTRHSGGDSEREQTLNQLLSEMDGFDTSKGIVVLAATNRPEVLDKALLRPGRFDRRVIVSKPDLQGRIDTLKVHSKDVKMDQTVNFKELALATAGAVGADLANIINEAALLAVRNRRDFVSQADLLGSVEVVFAGKEKKEKLLSPKEKEIVAYHEVGHALVSALQKNTLPIQRITIVPRTGGALGYVWQVPEEEKQLESKKELEEEIVICLAGRAAEELKFDSVTSGAANDIEKATSIARTMITMYGMSDKFGMVQLESVTGQYLDNRRVLNCSSETETKVDTEVKNMIKASYEKAIKLLKKNMTTLDAIATVLYEKENLTGDEFMKLYETHQNVKLKNAADNAKAGVNYEL
ncbi:MAG: ATP-dependent zinc metalloprotease FtsH [Clostridium sp.]|nr:ATP-dependent zinc metalloprotease FtsH [Clostridium sp.]MCM1170916.1 ATP-dependent zinc metalloprotease FtsH [Clostridium sp.]MCM1207350.1 ATP-dependent zinc metalloprotease FtsH [Ruminococcus sp.]